MIFLTFLRIVILNQRFGNTGEYTYQSHGADCIDHKFQRQEGTWKLPEVLADEAFWLILLSVLQ